MQVYLIGSLRNKEIPNVAAKIREYGLTVFDQWYSAGPNADDHLRDHFVNQGMNHSQVLQTAAAKNIFEFDKKHILASDIVVLLMPAGKSGFLELGWALGQGKPGYILYDQDPERIDVMFQFADGIFYDVDTLIKGINAKGLQQVSQQRTEGRCLCRQTDKVGKSVPTRPIEER